MGTITPAAPVTSSPTSRLPIVTSAARMWMPAFAAMMMPAGKVARPIRFQATLQRGSPAYSESSPVGNSHGAAQERAAIAVAGDPHARGKAQIAERVARSHRLVACGRDLVAGLARHRQPDVEHDARAERERAAEHEGLARDHRVHRAATEDQRERLREHARAERDAPAVERRAAIEAELHAPGRRVLAIDLGAPDRGHVGARDATRREQQRDRELHPTIREPSS